MEQYDLYENESFANQLREKALDSIKNIRMNVLFCKNIFYFSLFDSQLFFVRYPLINAPSAKFVVLTDIKIFHTYRKTPF